MKVPFEKLRKEHEGELIVVSEQLKDTTLYVVLRDITGKFTNDRENNFFCHRYFTVGSKEHVSIDGQWLSMKTAFAWAFNPKAISNEQFEGSF